MKRKKEKFPNIVGETAEIFCSERTPLPWVRGKIVEGAEHLVTIETPEGERISCNKLRLELYREVVYRKSRFDIKFLMLKTLKALLA